MESVTWRPDPALLSRYDEVARKEHLLPVQVPGIYRRLVEEEVSVLGDTAGPLYKVVYPTAERLDVRAPGEVVDFINERSIMPKSLAGRAIRKYQDRLAVLLTEKCSGHCMYCCRQDILTSPEDLDREKEFTDALVAYLADNPDIREVILTGGDPMTASTALLAHVVQSLKNAGVMIRLHTRNAVFAPKTLSTERLQVLRDGDVRVAFHITHPYELHDQARAAITEANAMGIRCYSQTPLLRGVNDHAEVLARMFVELDELHVRPLSVYIADPISFSAPFRVSLDRVAGLSNTLNRTTPSWVNHVAFVLDSPIGKVRLDNIVARNRNTGTVTFERDGQTVDFQDFPAELDEPGDLKTMLWRGL